MVTRDRGWKKDMPLSPALSRSWIHAGKQREQRADSETLLLLLHLLLSLGLLILTLPAGQKASLLPETPTPFSLCLLTSLEA